MLWWLTDAGSSGDIGTLYHARNYLGLKNVSSEAHKNYYAASELVDKTVTALIIKGEGHLTGCSASRCRYKFIVKLIPHLNSHLLLGNCFITV